jgi:hypothetical protein
MALGQMGLVLAELELKGEQFLATSTVLKARMLELAKKGEEHAKSIAPVGEHAHTLKSGYRDEPGDYKDSIEGMVVMKNGRWVGRVIARDYKAHWIEYGTKKMPKQAVMRRTEEWLKGGGA